MTTKFETDEPPLDKSLKRVLFELSFVAAGLVILYILFLVIVQFNYTHHAQNATKSFGERAYDAILTYTADYNNTLPTKLEDSDELKESLRPYRSIDYSDSPEVSIAFNDTIAGKCIASLDPKTEIFTITNTYLWNNYKVVYRVDGSKAQSELSSK